MIGDGGLRTSLTQRQWRNSTGASFRDAVGGRRMLLFLSAFTWLSMYLCFSLLWIVTELGDTERDPSENFKTAGDFLLLFSALVQWL